MNDDLFQRLIDGAHYSGLYGMGKDELSDIVNLMLAEFRKSGESEARANKIAHPYLAEGHNFRIYPLSSPLLGDCIVFSWNGTHNYVWNSCMITMRGEIVIE